MTTQDRVVVLIDDEPLARETVRDMLKAGGYEKIFEFKNGQEALNFMGSCKVDMIVCDWEMPVMDGLTLLKHLKADEKLKNIPFIMITSPISNEKMKVTDAGTLGVDAYIIKPFRRRVLMQKISDLLFEQKWQAKRGVLVADDDEQVRNFIVDALTTLGFFPIYAAKDGQEGLELLQSHISEISLVISDWEMPRLSGIEFLRRVRTTRSLADMPFIIVTSQTEKEQAKVRLAIESEVDQYLMKPFRLNVLKEKIELVLGNAKAEEMKKKVLDNARLALEDYDSAEAERLFDTVLSNDSQSVDACLGLAAVELQREPAKGLEAGIHWIEKAIRINPKAERAYLELAKVYESAMALEKAISQLKLGLDSCPPSPNLHFHLARILIRRGRFEEANRHLEKVLELDPHHKEAKNLYNPAIGTGPKTSGGS